MAKKKSDDTQIGPPTVLPQKAIEGLRKKIEDAKSILTLNYNDPRVTAWVNTTANFVEAAFGNNHHNCYAFQSASGLPISMSGPDSQYQDSHIHRTNKRIELLNGYIEQIEFLAPAPSAPQLTEPSESNVLKQLNNLFLRFHKVARQLRVRHGDRTTLDVNDEYDVQDLLHALLKIHFDDVRPEEWTPSTAGKSSRTDFLLKKEQIVIEVKKTRDGLADKELGSQLIQDIVRYKEHPDCKTLFCFIYDPEGRVGNPHGLKNDLLKLAKDLKVIVEIHPEH